MISEFSTSAVSCIHAVHRFYENFAEFSLVETCTQASHLSDHVSAHLIVLCEDVFYINEVKEARVCLHQQLIHLCQLLCLFIVSIDREDVFGGQLFLDKVLKLTEEGLVHLVVQK